VQRIAQPPRSLAQLAEPYVEFARKAFSREATYRMEVFTNVGSLLVRVYLLRMLWTALYSQNTAPAGIPLHAIITYSTVALLMSLILEVDGKRIILESIREGTIATDLMKPIVLPLYFFSDGIGQKVFHALMIVPTLLRALLIVHTDVPGPAALAMFALSFALAYVVNFLLNFLMNAVAFWTLETFALQMMVRWVSDLLSGQIVQLIFLPGRLQRIVLGLPFAAIYSTPLLVYVGTIKPAQYMQALLTQLLWLVIFSVLATVVWHAAQRRVVIQGG